MPKALPYILTSIRGLVDVIEEGLFWSTYTGQSVYKRLNASPITPFMTRILEGRALIGKRIHYRSKTVRLSPILTLELSVEASIVQSSPALYPESPTPTMVLAEETCAIESTFKHVDGAWLMLQSNDTVLRTQYIYKHGPCRPTLWLWRKRVSQKRLGRIVSFCSCSGPPIDGLGASE